MTAPPASPEAVAAGCSCRWTVEGYEPAPFATREEAYRWRNRRNFRRMPHIEPLADPACPVHPARDDGGCDA